MLSSSSPTLLIPSLSYKLTPPRIIIKNDVVSFLINNNFFVPFDRKRMLEIRKHSKQQCGRWIFTSLVSSSLSPFVIKNQTVGEPTKMAIEKLLDASWEIADDHFKNFFEDYIVNEKPCLIAFDDDNNGTIFTGDIKATAIVVAYVPILEIFFTIPTVEEYVSNLPPIKLKSGNIFIIFRGLAHKSLLKYEKHDDEMERGLKTISGVFKDIWGRSDHVFLEYFMNFFISVKKIRPRNHVWVECNREKTNTKRKPDGKAQNNNVKRSKKEEAKENLNQSCDNKTQHVHHHEVPKHHGDESNDTSRMYNYYFYPCGCRREDQ